MKKSSTLLFLLFSHFCFSQNLVPNPSFEDTVSCPVGIGQINLAVGWSSYSQTPDYFNACNTSTNGTDQAGVPFNLFGYRTAENGNAYAGFYAFTLNAHNDREILGTQLVQPLTIGTRYFLAFYVSNASDSMLRINMGINKLGARFSTIAYSYSNPTPINNYADIYTNTIIADTVNWIKVSGSFIADSIYNFIAIGNFFTDDSTEHVYMNPNGAFAYYYIDDIRLSTDSNYVNAITEYNSTNLIKIVPNPARDWISIRGNDVRSLMLYDVLGRIIYTSNSEFISPIQINVSSFPKGIYFLKIETETKSIIKRIILQ